MDKKQILNIVFKLPRCIAKYILRLNAAFIQHKIYGPAYINYKNKLNDKEHLNFDNTEVLLKIINSSINSVPYYSKKYEGKTFKTIKDFQDNIDFIDKEIVMQSFDDFISSDLDPSKFIEGTTGGTSGKPLKLVIPKNRHIVELATMHSMWNTTGWNYHTRAVIRNIKLPEDKIYIINPITKEYIFDGFRLTEEYFEEIYKTIKKHNIQFIHAYPSTAYQFCTFLRDQNKDTSCIKAFFSGSENIFEYQKSLIQDQLGIRFYNWYGHSEKLVLGGYCEHSENYHMEPTYGYFELIDDQGKAINTPGQIGEIVGTTLHNQGMPLIRYRTGDYAEYVGDKCEHCGRELPIIKNVRGRWSGEKVFNKDGTYVTTTALNLHNDLYAVINGHQYIQDEKGALDILIIKSELYNETHEKRIYEHYASKLNNDTKVTIRYVDKLIKQPNGKFLHLLSRINK